MRRPCVVTAFALAIAASGAVTPADAGAGVTAGTAPAHATRTASPRDGAWRLPAQASEGGTGRRAGPRGVPGPPGSGVSPEGGVSPQASTAQLRPPRHRGTLRVTGHLRDGGTVRAAGLSWRPSRLPRGDRLLSFEVGYYWHACPAHGRCAA